MLNIRDNVLLMICFYIKYLIVFSIDGMLFQTETSLYFKAVDFTRADYKSQNKDWSYFEVYWCRGELIHWTSIAA